MEKYKVMPLSEYLSFFEERNDFIQSNQLEEQLSALSKLKRNRVEQFLDVLKEAGLDIDSGGFLKNEALPEKVFVLPYILWCLSGRNRPEFYSEFLEIITPISIPKQLLCSKLAHYGKAIKKKSK